MLLFGGGLMGSLAFSTGLAESMGRGITGWLPVRSTLSLTILFTAVAIVMSETTSNTAAANMIVPVAIAVAQASGVDPLEPALAATFGSSMGFMMPVSSPPNAIVYSSGHVAITSMMRHGIVLDIAGFIFIVLSDGVGVGDLNRGSRLVAQGSGMNSAAVSSQTLLLDPPIPGS